MPDLHATPMLTVIGNSYPDSPRLVVDVQPRPSASRAEVMAQRDRMLVDQAKTQFRTVESAELKWRQRAVRDLGFRAGDEQWEASVYRARTADRTNQRPCLILNQIPKFIRQVVNEARQNPMAMKARPVDGGADVKTAQVIQGLMRAIEDVSDADIAYETALDHAATIGKGFWRLVTEYSDPWSFEQEIRIKRVLNPLAVFLDPAARRDPDYHTAQYGLVVERVNKEWVCDTYGISNVTYAGWQTRGDTWVQRAECQIADYYFHEDQPIWMVKLPTGDLRYVPILQAPAADDDEQALDLQDKALQLIQGRLRDQGVLSLAEEEQSLMEHGGTMKRQSSLPVVWWLKLVGNMIVERTLWPGQYIPIIPCLGEEVLTDKELDYRGIVRDAEDAQRMFNYSRSAAAEAIALAPKAPFVGTAEQFKNYHQEWARANVTARAFLQYNAHVVNGIMVEKPTRVQAEPQIEAVTQFAMQSQADLNSIIGIYPSAIGEQSNEISGVAIGKRAQQSQTGSAHYPLNLQRAIRFTARQIGDLIPRVYVEPGRILRIIGDDMSQSMVAIHPQGQPEGVELPEGITGVYALGAGKYDYRVDSGPSYLTKRQETAATLTDMAASMPLVGQVMPDLIMATQDFSDVEEAVRRLRAALPPGILQEHEDAKPEEQVQILENQLSQLGSQMEQLNAYAQQQEHEAAQVMEVNKQLVLQIENKQGELDVKRQEEMDSAQLDLRKLQLETERLAWDKEKFLIELAGKEHQASIDAEMAGLKAQMAQLMTLLQRDVQADEALLAQEANDDTP